MILIEHRAAMRAIMDREHPEAAPEAQLREANWTSSRGSLHLKQPSRLKRRSVRPLKNRSTWSTLTAARQHGWKDGASKKLKRSVPISYWQPE